MAPKTDPESAPGGTSRNAIWRSLFAMPELLPSPAGHDSRCGLCQAPVDRYERRCQACGGVWREPEQNRHRWRNYGFGIAAMTVSLVFGRICHLLLADRLRYAMRASNPEMVEFLASYFWVLCTTAMLVLSTFLFELLPSASGGRWARPERSIDRGGATADQPPDRQA